MPASLRPNLLATLTLATTVSMTGCIFPFTRSNDTKLAEIVAEDAQPQPEKEVAAAPKPQGEKKMPPFARFLGGMFGGESTPQSEPEPEPDPITTTAAEPTQRVAAVPVKSTAPEPSTVLPAQELVEAKPQTPIFNPPNNQMPVVVTPETNPMADKPDVVSKFTQKATQMIESPRPEVVVQPTATPQAQPEPQPAPQAVPAPQVAKTTPVKLGDEALDAHARAPWGEKKLLEKAMANSSTNSTTLEHSLELALETVRRERLGEGPAPTTQPATPKPEMTAHVEIEETPSVPAQTKSAPPSMKVAANPLRTSSTKTDWSGSSLRNSQPQTIVNDKLATYPKTDSKWSPKQEQSQPAAEAVAKQEEPAVEPQLTVNPYANTPAEAIAATPNPGPQLVDNTTAAAKTAEETPSTTDDIHFQSSLLSKLQAANRQAKWDFDTTPQEPVPTAEVAKKPENVMPQIVKNDTVPEEPKLPQVAAKAPEQPTAERVKTEPKTTINPSVAQAEPKEEPQVIKPFIIAEPARATPARGGLIRAATPQPLVVENQAGNQQQVSPQAPKQLPTLAPVVRASDYQKPLPSNGGSKTYIVN